MNIIVAGLDELDTLANLFNQYRQFYRFPDAPQACKDYLRARIENDESVLLLAVEDGVGLGFVQLYPMFSSTQLKPIYILNDLFVAVDARRRGVGQSLLRRAREQAREAGRLSLELATAIDNLAAQTLYESEGWKRDTEFFHYWISANNDV